MVKKNKAGTNQVELLQQLYVEHQENFQQRNVRMIQKETRHIQNTSKLEQFQQNIVVYIKKSLYVR